MVGRSQESENPSKRRKTLLGDESEGSSDEHVSRSKGSRSDKAVNASPGGLEGPLLKINQSYAQRFEHNKQREELDKRSFGTKAVTRRSMADL